MRSILATLVMLPGFAFAATPPMCYKVVAEQGSAPLVANKWEVKTLGECRRTGGNFYCKAPRCTDPAGNCRVVIQRDCRKVGLIAAPASQAEAAMLEFLKANSLLDDLDPLTQGETPPVTGLLGGDPLKSDPSLKDNPNSGRILPPTPELPPVSELPGTPPRNGLGNTPPLDTKPPVDRRPPDLTPEPDWKEIPPLEEKHPEQPVDRTSLPPFTGTVTENAKNPTGITGYMVRKPGSGVVVPTPPNLNESPFPKPPSPIPSPGSLNAPLPQSPSVTSN